jgi:hypothetical protein
MATDITRLGYREIAERYDLGSLKVGGDLQLTASGDLKMTRDGDCQLGNDIHNALHRAVVRWQFNAPTLKALLDFVVNAERARAEQKDDLESVAQQLVVQRDEAIESWHRLHHDIGINEFATQAYAGTIMVVLSQTLRREWTDLNKPSAWETAGELLQGRSFGAVVEAASNNFRHSDEWAAAVTPTDQQLKSMEVLADVLGFGSPTMGVARELRSNVCPEALKAVSCGRFESLMDRFFFYARALAGLE